MSELDQLTYATSLYIEASKARHEAEARALKYEQALREADLCLAKTYLDIYQLEENVGDARNIIRRAVLDKPMEGK